MAAQDCCVGDAGADGRREAVKSKCLTTVRAPRSARRDHRKSQLQRMRRLPNAAAFAPPKRPAGDRMATALTLT